MTHGPALMLLLSVGAAHAQPSSHKCFVSFTWLHERVFVSVNNFSVQTRAARFVQRYLSKGPQVAPYILITRLVAFILSSQCYIRRGSSADAVSTSASVCVFMFFVVHSPGLHCNCSPNLVPGPFVVSPRGAFELFLMEKGRCRGCFRRSMRTFDALPLCKRPRYQRRIQFPPLVGHTLCVKCVAAAPEPRRVQLCVGKGCSPWLTPRLMR